jgi:hypothetical protein
MRNVLDRAVALQAQRIMSAETTVSVEEIRMLRPADLPAGGPVPDPDEALGQYL